MASQRTFPGAKLTFVALLVSIGGAFNFGYQLVITNPSQDAFLRFLNGSLVAHYGADLSTVELENVWSVIVAILFVGAIFGSLHIRFVAERFGRLKGLIGSFVLSTLFLVLSLISYFVDSIELYTVSRAVLGYTYGLIIGLSGLYLAESSPKSCRGFVSMATGVSVQLGTVVGSVIAMPNVFGTEHLWWCIYAAEALGLVVVSIPLVFAHDSPSYLCHKGEEDAARRAVKFFHACGPDEVDEVLREMKEHVNEEEKTVGMLEVLEDKVARRGTLVGSVITLAMAFSGMPVVDAFAVDILLNCGMDINAASYGNLLLTIVSVVAIVGSSFVVERFGRRSLLLGSIVAIILTNVAVFALMLAFDLLQYPWIGFTLIAAIALFIMFFATGPGPLCYFVTAELVGQRARSAAQSWNTLIQMISRAIILAAYLPMKNAIGGSFAYLILFVAPMIFAELVIYFYLPETKNRNVKQIQEAIKDLPRIQCRSRR
uniref:MFS domain-containing protein n=1 Tax=Steinernema glaseri TaxID=37863 RepID=A0A1I7Z618_9BILA